MEVAGPYSALSTANFASTASMNLSMTGIDPMGSVSNLPFGYTGAIVPPNSAPRQLACKCRHLELPHVGMVHLCASSVWALCEPRCNFQTKRLPHTSCPHLCEIQVEFPSPTPEELAAYAAARESQASMHQSMAAGGGDKGALSSSRMGSIDLAD